MDEANKPSQNNRGSQAEPELGRDPAVEEFFTRMGKGIRHPKPGQEAVSAALQAVQRLALEVDAEQSAEQAESSMCNSCGAANRAGNRFCSSCGVPLYSPSPTAMPENNAPPQAPAELPRGEHHYHHHYHHHYFSSSDAVPTGASPEARPTATGMRVRPSVAGAGLSRAEAAVRKLTQDWAVACNSKHIDDLIDLYTADATLMRPNYSAVRGAAAIREFLCGVLDAGLGDVELDPLRTDVLGEVAYEAGRFKSLVPSLGKRREERGKYLLVSIKHNGEWRIVADTWSSDLGVEAIPPTAAPKAPRR